MKVILYAIVVLAAVFCCSAQNLIISASDTNDPLNIIARSGSQTYLEARNRFLANEPATIVYWNGNMTFYRAGRVTATSYVIPPIFTTLRLITQIPYAVYALLYVVVL